MPSELHPTPIFCRKCGYDLRGSVEFKRCPECGQPFDPADPKTYLSRLPGRRWKWIKRFLLLLLAVGVLLGGTWGWLYWGWRNEQNAVKAMGARVWKTEALGGEKLQSHLGSVGWVLDRAVYVIMPLRTTDADLLHLKGFKRLQGLWLERTQVTDAGLINLKEFKELETLDLDYTQITDAGLVNLKQLKGLQWLYLDHTQITDADLVYLEELKGLQRLNLSDTRVTPDGIKELGKALPRCFVVGPRSASTRPSGQ